MRQRVFEACRNEGIRVDAKSGYAGKRSRTFCLAMKDGVAIGHGCFTGRAHINGRGDAVVEHGLAKIPTVGVLRIEEPGKNVLSIRLDDPGIRGIRRRLPLARYAGDPVALDHDDGILNWRPAVAVNQRAAFDYQRRSLLRLRGRQAAQNSQKQK